jgi:hemolysin activation/secretion protein
LGTSNVSQLEKARAGAGSSAALRWSVDGNATLLNHARLNMQFIGQYTGSKLVPSGQMAVAGDRVGVRGFINAVLMGDSVAVLRTELEPKLSSNLGLNIRSRPYVFYDIGYKHGGNDQRNLSVASTGLGWRWTLPQGDSHGLLFDVYAAHKLQGASLDLQPGTTTKVSKTTLWATGTYRF